MAHKRFISYFFALALSFSLFACSENKEGENNTTQIIESVKDLEGKKVASLSGCIFYELTKPFVDNIQDMYFEDSVSMIQALLNNKVDAVLFDEPVARSHCAIHPKELYIADIFVDDSYGFALKKNSPLTPKINEIIALLEKAGELEKIKDKWFNITPETEELTQWSHKKDYTGKNGTLIMGIDPVLSPMGYIGSRHKAVGIEVDIANRIAYELDMKLETVSMNFSALIPSVEAGKVDMAGSAMSITDSRKELVDMTNTHYKGGIAILVRRPDDYEALSSIEKELHLAKNGRAGVMTGSYGEVIVDEEFNNKNIFSFESFPDGIPALKSEKIDYIIGSYSSLIAFTRTNKDLIILPTALTEDGNAIAYKKGSNTLKEDIDKIISKFRGNGTLADLEQRWIKDFNYDAPIIAMEEDAPVIKVGIAANREPVCFVQDGRYVGYDCELIESIARELGKRVEYVDMKFSSLIPSLQANKVDLIISNITKTKERMKSVDFSQIYFLNPQALLVHKNTYNKILGTNESFSEKELGIWASLKDSFDRTFIVEDRYKLILDGLAITIIISLATAVFGIFSAFFICAMRRSNRLILNMPAKIYIRLMQGMPMVVLLMILYYIVFAKVDINAVWVAIIGFSMHFAAYTAEIMRTGVDSLDKGQIEAASAMGYRKYQVFKNIIFPQAARHCIPVLQGEFIATVKMTSVAGYIAIQDLTKVSDIIRSRTYEAFFPLIATAIIYFLLAYIFTCILTYIERKIDPKSRKRTIRKVVL